MVKCTLTVTFATFKLALVFWNYKKNYSNSSAFFNSTTIFGFKKKSILSFDQCKLRFEEIESYLWKNNKETLAVFSNTYLFLIWHFKPKFLTFFYYRLNTMSDFHDFGLAWKCQKIFPCGCTITSKTKLNVVWNFFYTPGAGTLRTPSVRKNFKQRWF